MDAWALCAPQWQLLPPPNPSLSTVLCSAMMADRTGHGIGYSLRRLEEQKLEEQIQPTAALPTTLHAEGRARIHAAATAVALASYLWLFLAALNPVDCMAVGLAFALCTFLLHRNHHSDALIASLSDQLRQLRRSGPSEEPGCSDGVGRGPTGDARDAMGLSERMARASAQVHPHGLSTGEADAGHAEPAASALVSEGVQSADTAGLHRCNSHHQLHAASTPPARKLPPEPGVAESCLRGWPASPGASPGGSIGVACSTAPRSPSPEHYGRAVPAPVRSPPGRARVVARPGSGSDAGGKYELGCWDARYEGLPEGWQPPAANSEQATPRQQPAKFYLAPATPPPLAGPRRATPQPQPRTAQLRVIHTPTRSMLLLSAEPLDESVAVLHARVAERARLSPPSAGWPPAFQLAGRFVIAGGGMETRVLPQEDTLAQLGLSATQENILFVVARLPSSSRPSTGSWPRCTRSWASRPT
ncbi:hypothetical protein T492DRAFT_984212 [Pavlovales sp. CCMP2436]|nr:hypothetical protein T492DRAFT_984212 [Pavlovales sp. CCMP2436]